MECPCCHRKIGVKKTKLGRPMICCPPCGFIGFINGQNAIRKIMRTHRLRVNRRGKE